MTVDLSNLGNMYDRLGYYSKAEKLLLQSVDAEDSSDVSSAVRLQNVGQLYADEQRYSQAFPLLEQALALERKAKDETAEAFTLEVFGNARRDDGQFAEATRLYNQALVQRERDYPDGVQIAQLLDDMVLLAIRQGRYGEAEPLLVRAMRIYDKLFPFDNAHTALCLTHRAMLYRGEKSFAGAETAFARAITMYEKSVGEDAPALAPALREYAELCRLMNQGAKSAELEARARKLTQGETARNAAARK